MSNILAEMERSREEVSYTTLFKEHSKLIYKLIHNFVKAKNINLQNSEVDDIFQEVALKIFKNDYISKYNSEKSSFITWLNIICRTTAIDYYRKKLRWMEAILSERHPARTFQTVDAVLFSLPAGVLTGRQTEVITLLFKEGLETGEVAQRLGITNRTVRSLKFQALERLRDHYGASAPIHAPRTAETQRRKVS
ncbi:sigma-70 family RNA polymerase sigma factor [Pseudodesulfovibrio cashew]|uniref:Sigma-70 family RNA polymerase sigma factor n=1 Tax=Pseudodesulfovibrio cashew TaxID=2678688 RepID=A0A6I6JHJ0_9BACT|nr:sigma-70 family RNA polymerase sigma factor [Pseudodesulfovibrio cashew]QGY39557.1 sigma-70 family RNA polymerase sigma factor [Pseudodesulfovibrio cashew]